MERSRRFHVAWAASARTVGAGGPVRRGMAMMIRNAVARSVAHRRWRPADDATHQLGLDWSGRCKANWPKTRVTWLAPELDRGSPLWRSCRPNGRHWEVPHQIDANRNALRQRTQVKMGLTLESH